MPQEIRHADIPRSYPVDSTPAESAPDPIRDETVLVNGKTPEPVIRDDARASGATREARASKTTELKLAGQAQQARFPSARIQDSDRRVHGGLVGANQSGTVFVDGASAVRKEDATVNCENPKEVIDPK